MDRGLQSEVVKQTEGEDG